MIFNTIPGNSALWFIYFLEKQSVEMNKNYNSGHELLGFVETKGIFLMSATSVMIWS